MQSLVSQSAEIQKVLTFEGAFERLFGIITSEGGVEGGMVTRGALACVDALLRFNSSNQVLLPHYLPSYPPNIAAELLQGDSAVPNNISAHLAPAQS